MKNGAWRGYAWKAMVGSLGLALIGSLQAAWLQELRGPLVWDGPGHHLRPIKTSQDSQGNRHIRYVQYIQGIPVFGHQVISHERKRTRPSAYRSGAASGGYSPAVWTGTMMRVPGTPAFFGKKNSHVTENWQDIQPAWENGTGTGAAHSPDLLLAIQHHYLSGFPPSVSQSVFFANTHIHPVYVLPTPDSPVRLAYFAHFFVDGPELGPHRPHVLWDPQTHQPWSQWEGLTRQRIGNGPGGNPKTGCYEYGVDRPALDITQQGTQCRLENDFVKTLDLRHGLGFGPPHRPAATFTCYRQAEDAVNGGCSPLNDAHAFTQMALDMYQAWYGMIPVPLPMVVRVHYNWQFENAFWDGKTLTFGDGNERLYPPTSAGTVSHELAHAVTEQFSNLIYTGESGGINESFSDMAAKAVAFYAGHTDHDWQVGSEDSKWEQPIRDMANPPSDGFSIAYAYESKPHIDVHHLSGVFNRAFYLLATTPGWDTRQAFDVFFDANRHYWTPSTQFTEGAEGVLRATWDRQRPLAPVIAAFERVGIACTVDTIPEDTTADPMDQEVHPVCTRMPAPAAKNP